MNIRWKRQMRWRNMEILRTSRVLRCWFPLCLQTLIPLQRLSLDCQFTAYVRLRPSSKPPMPYHQGGRRVHSQSSDLVYLKPAQSVKALKRIARSKGCPQIHGIGAGRVDTSDSAGPAHRIVPLFPVSQVIAVTACTMSYIITRKSKPASGSPANRK